MFSSITHALGLSAAPTPSTSGSTDSIVAEPNTTAVAFPAANSQQRARAPAPSFAISPPPDAPRPPTGDDDDDEGNGGEEDEPALPELHVDGAGALAPPTTTVKVVKAPKGRVRVEKGFSQLDWARLNRSGEVDLRGGVTELRRITPSELAKHNTRDDCWQAYGGKVYNVGPFLKFHPGGAGEMMRGAGKDATQLFMLAHAWVNYDTLLENCLVGFLVRE